MNKNNKITNQLMSEILNPDIWTDESYIRKIIISAEDENFTVEQSKIVAPWLLKFAEYNKYNSDPENEAAVWSAIRTGSSMLYPYSINDLLPLLELGHTIDTSLVTTKMIGRIFEAQPPTEMNEYKKIAKRILLIASTLLKKDIISIRDGALIQLSVYALIAMGSDDVKKVITNIKIYKKEEWFIRQLIRRIKKLKNIWESQVEPTSKNVTKLLNETILMLENMRNNNEDAMQL